MKTTPHMQRTRIKLCGVTRVDDALSAAEFGADAVGVILTDKSRRCVAIERACEIRRALPPLVTLVALFMDDLPGYIAEAVAAVQPDLLQFHGNEIEQDCLRYGVPYFKAVAMADRVTHGNWPREYAQARAFVLDGHGAGEQGGSGRTFDWTKASGQFGRPIVLAGGLTAHNVGAAIRTAHPYAVDVSSGIELAPGVKDVQRMRDFVRAVRDADEACARD